MPKPENQKNILLSEKVIKELCSFKDVYQSVPRKDTGKIKEEIKKRLNIKQDPAFYKRVNGEVKPNTLEMYYISEIFKPYGLKPFTKFIELINT